MSEDSSGRGDSPLLRSAREIVRLVLSSLYRVAPPDAGRLERELLSWFDRLRRRPGAPQTVALLRSQLIVMACRVAHVYWTSQPEVPLNGDDHLERTLALGPDAAASELEARLAGSGGNAPRD